MRSEHEWLFGLISSDDLERRRALVRFRNLNKDLLTANSARNDVYWRVGGEWSPADPALSRAMNNARTASSSVYSSTIYSRLSTFAIGCRVPQPGPDPVIEPFAVLFLEWEQACPEDWDREAGGWGSRWGWKESTLKVMGRHGVGQSHRSEGRTARPDRDQPPLPRQGLAVCTRGAKLDNPGFRGSLHSTGDHPDEDVKLKAAFVTSRVARPELSANRRSYGSWRLEHAAGHVTADTEADPQQ